ncbi:MAG: hypothetical protein JXR37_23715 [Kiritimatiellae bacterium]|nr:hypothetical protein [Kiritimatiellia bacterium]
MTAPCMPLEPGFGRVLIHARGRMTPPECGFWQRLRFALRECGLELVLLAHHRANAPMDVPLLRAFNGLDAVPPGGGTGQALAPDDDPEALGLLARERMWRGPERDAPHRDRRRRALCHFRDFYTAVLKTAEPVLTLIWNGHHAQEMILASLCRTAACPVGYVERGPFQGTLHLDPVGILGGSSVAGRSDWEWATPETAVHWQRVMAQAQMAYRHSGGTWWEQPPSRGAAALRRSLQVPEGAKVLFFAGQVDADTQNLLYAPEYADNRDAFAGFCEALRGRDGVFVLGKHHPHSVRAPADYQAVVGRQGVWVTDVSVADCLAVADRAAAVNSTVLYEALMLGTPVLAMGRGLLHGKRIAYEPTDRATLHTAVSEWLAAEDQAERERRWLDFGAYLLAHALYAMAPPESAAGLRNAAALATDLAGMVRRNSAAPVFGRLPAGPDLRAFSGLVPAGDGYWTTRAQEIELFLARVSNAPHSSAASGAGG